MVAEPVNAAIEFLQSSYINVTDTVASLLGKFTDQVLGWTLPFVGWGSKPTVSSSTELPSFSGKWTIRVKDHKYEIAAAAAVSSLVAFSFYRLYNQIDPQVKRSLKKRRVPKLPNGARKDVVLVVGLPTEPFTRLLALDFEKRGFIVYLTILDEKDYKYTQSHPITDDLNYLNLSEGADLAAMMAKFHLLLQVPVLPIKGGDEHLLQLSAVVFAPHLYFPIGPLENFPTAAWERVISRMGLYTRLLSLGFLQLVRLQKSKIIVIVPNIVNKLSLAYHGPETVLQSGIQDLFLVLSKEVAPQGISVTQIRLGNLNLSALSPKSRVPAMVEAEIRSWDEDVQSLYGTQFLKQQGKTLPALNTLRNLALLSGLHHLLFDIIFGQKRPSSVMYYGTGARAYEWLAALLPLLLMQLFM